jgi:xanthine dehydrogenase YagR molybdenum-binding subunit
MSSTVSPAPAPARGLVTASLGAPLRRLEGREKVTGQARFAYEHQAEGVAYAFPVQSTVAKGAIRALDASDALALPGVLAVLWHENTPPLQPYEDDTELALFQSPAVAYRGQFVAAVVAERWETARQAAALVRIDYDAQPADLRLSADRPDLYRPDDEEDVDLGDVDAALAEAAVTIDRTYTTPAIHNNPMEPHATLAVWDGGDLTLHDSTQGAHPQREAVAAVFGLELEQVRVISEHVGGGFGSKGPPHPPVILAALAAKVTGRPVKVALTRQQMFAVVGYRTPTIQRVRLGADAGGRLTAIEHASVEQTSTLAEFAEGSTAVSKVMYAAPHRRMRQRLARLDVASPSWMRAPGECPGMYALEAAIDELAIAGGFDPIELRIANDPGVHPHEGKPFSSRNLVACLRDGAERFGWAGRDPEPGVRRDGRWLVGTGVAASTYPAYRGVSSATARDDGDGRYTVLVGAADIGTGARTALAQIAADALGVSAEAVSIEIGDSALPQAPWAGGSSGTSSWGTAVDKACRALRAERSGDGGRGEREVTVDTEEEVGADSPYVSHAFGAQFCEVRVDVDSGEVRVPRLLGVFAVGRIVNPVTARSQLIGGMTMGISMALHEESVLDLEFGDYVNHDFAGYHVATCADVLDVEAIWVDEDDPHVNPMGAKGVGEIGIVGTAAAVANAVHHATGIRVRDLPIRLDKLLPGA